MLCLQPKYFQQAINILNRYYYKQNYISVFMAGWKLENDLVNNYMNINCLKILKVSNC